MRPVARAVAGLLLALAAASPAAAQATRDQARLVFTVFGAFNGGGDLWDVGVQPVRFPNFDPDEVDSLALARKLSSGFGLGVSATYYPGPVLGYVGEVALLGVGYEDRCELISPPTNNTGEVVCDGIQGSERGASMVLLSAGVVARAMSQGVISPYVRAGLGLAIGSQSSIRMFGPTDGTQGEIFLVYEDESNTRVTPALLLGAGLTGQVSPGMQFRLEARDNIVGFATVSGPTATDGLVPESETEYKHVWTVMFGVDIVLERKRGRRY
ncbi:MAG TPA: hypothetical protein VLA95_09960 [Gemmatimonadales bacterium]|nr:hypothetical protein [Gemmatimonadales bacterium]